MSWTWDPPQGVEEIVVRPFDEGVIALVEDGVFALSGETGDVLWSYRDPGKTLLSNVTTDGEHVVLHEEENSRTILLDRDSGRISHEFSLDMSEYEHTYRVREDHLSDALKTVSGNSWVVRWKDMVASHDLEDGGASWVASDVAKCSFQGSVDSISVSENTVVAATTCYEQPEGQDSVEWSVSWEFTSEFVGLDPGTGEELWRIEHTVGRMPRESLQREIYVCSEGLLCVAYLDSPDLEPSLLETESRKVTDLETRSLLWISDDAGQRGLWDTETGVYRIEDPAGNVERESERGLVSMNEDIVKDGYRVGLEGGVLYLEERVEDTSASEGFARFEGFDGSAILTWDEAESLRVADAISVPGAVAVAYVADGQAGVMGLR